MGIAAEQCGHTNVAAHLHDVGEQPFLAEKAALLGDVEIDRSDAAARVGDDDFFQRGLCARVRSKNDKQEKCK